MRIAFLQVTSPEIYEYSQYSTAINKKYCEKHGYEYIEVPVVLAETYAPQWSKIFQVLRHLQSMDYTHIFFLDADAVVLNDNITLEDRISQMKTSIAFSENDWNGGELINTGAFIATVEAIPFLQECIRVSQEELPNLQRDYWHEQTVVNLLKDRGWLMDVWSMNTINSYWLHNYKNNTDQFIYHFMARPLHEKVAIAQELAVIKKLV